MREERGNAKVHMRVLVAEGDREVRGYLVLLLSAMGFEAAGVGGLDALSRRVARRAPDAVLCDVNTADGDGIEVGRRLQLLRPELPIVLMAWDHSGVARARSAVLGPVLLKPFSPAELREALTFVLFSRLRATLSRAVSELKMQTDQIQAQLEVPHASRRST